MHGLTPDRHRADCAIIRVYYIMEKTIGLPVEKTVRFLSKVSDSQQKAVTFQLGDGQILKTLLTDYPAHIREQLELHGLSQKIGDAASGCAKEKEYRAALATMTAVHEALKAGKWGADREMASSALMEDLIDVIMKLKGLKREVVAESVHLADAATIKSWLRHPAIDEGIQNARLIRARSRSKAEAAGAEFDFPVQGE